MLEVGVTRLVHVMIFYIPLRSCDFTFGRGFSVGINYKEPRVRCRVAEMCSDNKKHRCRRGGKGVGPGWHTLLTN